MAKKGKWLSKFCVCAKEDVNNESDKRTGSKKKNARRKLKKGERNSFISLFSEPSSIEKILEDAEREQALTYRPQLPLEPSNKASDVLPEAGLPKASSLSVTSPTAAAPRTAFSEATSPRAGSLRVVIPRDSSLGDSPPRKASPRVVSPKAVSPPKAASPRVATPRDESPTPSPPRPPSRGNFSKAASLKKIHRQQSVSTIDPVFAYHHASATTIQAVYRGYASRKITGSARGLIRLKLYVRGQCIRRQTANAVKRMQLLVRVQTRLESQRFRMLEFYALQHGDHSKSDKQEESITSDAANNKDWDDSILTKEEKDIRNKRKEEAVRNKERAMAFLRSHQISRFTSESDQSVLMDLCIDGLPWSWNWSERHLLMAVHLEEQAKKNAFSTPKSTTSSSAFRGNQSQTPRSSRSLTPNRFTQLQTPYGTPRSQYSSSSPLTKYLKHTAGGSQSPFNTHFSDTDSLQSCPNFSAPRYMSPTASASSKMRLNDNIKDRYVSSPSSQSNRRLTYPLTPRSGTSTSRVSLVPDTDANSHITIGTNCSSHSIDNISVGTTSSLPDSRKPFNRFV